jgi:hypothetical protein
MDRLNKILAVVALFLGVVGALACIALIIGALLADSRLREATRSAYSDVDDLFSKARERVRSLEKVVDESKVTTSDVKGSLATLASRTAEERLTQEIDARLRLEAKTSDLAAAFAKADSFAEMSADSLSLVIKVADMANQAGARIDREELESLQSEIGQLRGKLSEAVDDVTNLSTRLQREGDASGPRDRIDAAAELVVRVLATLDVIQSGLHRIDEKLGASQQKLADSEPQLMGWLRLTTAIVIFLLFWSFAGQFALGRTGWQTIRG